jgi:hypothetical protein
VVHDGWRILKLILRERFSRLAARTEALAPVTAAAPVADETEVPAQASVEGA